MKVPIQAVLDMERARDPKYKNIASASHQLRYGDNAKKDGQDI